MSLFFWSIYKDLPDVPSLFDESIVQEVVAVLKVRRLKYMMTMDLEKRFLPAVAGRNEEESKKTIPPSGRNDNLLV